MKYVKLTARKDTWYVEGTEAYHYDCDETNKYRYTLDEWNTLKSEKGNWGVLVRGTRISENKLSENVEVGDKYFDGEFCNFDEFDVEIVDERC